MDESVLVSDLAGAGTYVLAAVIAAPDTCEGIRETLRGLVPARQKRLHWKDEDTTRRDTITAVVAGLDLVGIVTVGSPVERTRQERARRYCMQRLLFELDQLGVSHVWLEARTPTLNRRDLTMVAGMRNSKAIPAHLRVDFARPLLEEMLWLPDVVAGTVSAVQRDQGQWFDQLRGSVELIEVKVG